MFTFCFFSSPHLLLFPLSLPPLFLLPHCLSLFSSLLLFRVPACSAGFQSPATSPALIISILFLFSIPVMYTMTAALFPYFCGFVCFVLLGTGVIYPLPTASSSISCVFKTINLCVHFSCIP